MLWQARCYIFAYTAEFWGLYFGKKMYSGGYGILLHMGVIDGLKNIVDAILDIERLHHFLSTFECRVSLKLEKFGRFFLRHLPSINHQKVGTLGESRPIFPNLNTLQLNLSYSPTLILLHERVVDERTSIPLLQ